MPPALSLLLVLVIALVLYRRKSLTRGGVAGVLGIGAAVLLKLGGSWMLIVGVLFACMVAVTRVNDRRTGGFKKSSARGLIDLLPVGGAVTASALLADEPNAQQLILAAMSFALADIFASELGPAFGSRTAVLLPSMRQVPHGTPGAVSAAGFAFGAAGSLLAAGVAFVAARDPWAALAVFCGGQLGAFCDGVAQRLVPRSWPLRSDLINGAGVLIALAITGIYLGATPASAGKRAARTVLRHPTARVEARFVTSFLPRPSCSGSPRRATADHTRRRHRGSLASETAAGAAGSPPMPAPEEKRP